MTPALAALLWLNIKALDLCRESVRGERSQRDAAEGAAIVAGQQQPPARRRVVPGKAGKLGIEALEAQIDL